MSELAQADWGLLQHLSLNDNDLGAAAMQSLCMMPLPGPTQLEQSCASIPGQGPYWHAQGSWPQLQSLSLTGNPSGQRGFQQLLKGALPLLKYLTV